MPVNLAYLGLVVLLVGFFSNVHTHALPAWKRQDVSDYSEGFPLDQEYSYEIPQTYGDMPLYQSRQAATAPDHDLMYDIPYTPVRVSAADQAPSVGSAVENNRDVNPAVPTLANGAKEKNIAAAAPTAGLDALGGAVSNHSQPVNLLTGKDEKPDFGFVNSQNSDGQLRKITYGVDAKGNIVAHSAQVIDSLGKL